MHRPVQSWTFEGWVRLRREQNLMKCGRRKFLCQSMFPSKLTFRKKRANSGGREHVSRDFNVLKTAAFHATKSTEKICRIQNFFDIKISWFRPAFK